MQSTFTSSILPLVPYKDTKLFKMHSQGCKEGSRGRGWGENSMISPASQQFHMISLDRNHTLPYTLSHLAMHSTISIISTSAPSQLRKICIKIDLRGVKVILEILSNEKSFIIQIISGWEYLSSLSCVFITFNLNQHDYLPHMGLRGGDNLIRVKK